jgi:flagellar assembly factor FliW
MQVITHRFGTVEHVEVDDADVYHFEPGLGGFERLHRYALVRDEDSPVEWLQSLEEPDVVFALIEPFLFHPDYGFELADRECGELGLERPQDAMVRCVLTLSSSVEEITANLLAPIVLNQATGRGRQVVLQDANLPLRFPVFEAVQMPLAA